MYPFVSGGNSYCIGSMGRGARHLLSLSLISFVLFFFSSSLYAQDLLLPQYISYGRKEGLPQAQVTTLMQDSRGYIWVGTKNGVARFNGKDFYSFTVRDGLAGDLVLGIKEDKKNQVWVLCRRGISCISGESISTTSMQDLLLKGITIGQNDTIWFYGEDSRKNAHMLGYLYQGEYSKFEMPKDIFIYGIEYDATNNRLLILSEEGVYSFDGTLKEEYKHETKYKEGHLYFLTYINNRMLYIQKNKADKNLKVYEIQKGGLRLIGQSVNREWIRPLPSSIRDEFTLFLSIEYHFIAGGKYYDWKDFEGHFITSILLDKKGVLWLGTERGLLRTYPDAIQQYSTSHLPEVWGVVQDNDGVIWTCSYTNEIKTIRENQVHQVQMDKKRYYYFHPVKDSGGALYIPHNTGVTKIKPNHSSVELQSSSNSHMIYTYFDPKRKLILVGGWKRVEAWNEQEELVREIKEVNGLPIVDNVLSIAQDSVGNYWFGGRSMYRYHWESECAQEYLPTIEGNICYEIATDAHGVVWFATHRGLFYYDRKVDRIQAVASPELQGLASFVLPLDRHVLLTSQPNGLYLLSLDDFHEKGKVTLSYINEFNGYLSEGPEQAGAYLDDKGGVWITSNTTLSRIQLDKIVPTTLQKANIIFKEYNNKPIQFNQTEIQLPFNQNSVTIKLDAIAYSRTYPITYKYRTSPAEPWSEEISDDWIVLPDLPHGRTTLYVQPMYKGLGIEASDQIYMLHIKVNKAIYNQNWFVPSLATVLLVLLIFALVKLGNIKIRLQNASARAKISEIETIQAQMNPHFVYNILANVQAKIRNEKVDVAERQLLRLSQLIRGFLHSSINTTINDEHTLKSNKHLIDLESELKFLHEFISFQQELYPKTFVYDLRIDNDIDVSQVKIPSMILQPLVENAISHGLIPKGSIGTLCITIQKGAEAGDVIIVIADDGIGMKRSEEMHQSSKLRYPSYGRKLTLRRIALLNSLGYNIKMDTQTSEHGTTITIEFNS